jgi:hypothetical protein
MVEWGRGYYGGWGGFAPPSYIVYLVNVRL